MNKHTHNDIYHMNFQQNFMLLSFTAPALVFLLYVATITFLNLLLCGGTKSLMVQRSLFVINPTNLYPNTLMLILMKN